MNIAIIYSSRTGNTRIIAETIKKTKKKENIVYFGNPTEDLPEADIYIIGSWTDKGNPTDEIINVLKKIKSKKLLILELLALEVVKNILKSCLKE